MTKYIVYEIPHYWAGFYFSACEADENGNIKELESEEIVSSVLEEARESNSDAYEHGERKSFDTLDEAEAEIQNFLKTATFDIRNVKNEGKPFAEITGRTYKGFLDFATLQEIKYDEDGDIESYEEEIYYANPITLEYNY